jgi:hypothetical protein
MDPYMKKMEALIREGKGRLDRLSVSMRDPAPSISALDRRRKLREFEARYAEVSRHFEQLRSAGSEGLADLKVGLEKALDAFRLEIDWKAS